MGHWNCSCSDQRGGLSSQEFILRFEEAAHTGNCREFQFWFKGYKYRPTFILWCESDQQERCQRCHKFSAQFSIFLCRSEIARNIYHILRQRPISSFQAGCSPKRRFSFSLWGATKIAILLKVAATNCIRSRRQYSGSSFPNLNTRIFIKTCRDVEPYKNLSWLSRPQTVHLLRILSELYQSAINISEYEKLVGSRSFNDSSIQMGSALCCEN